MRTTDGRLVAALAVLAAALALVGCAPATPMASSPGTGPAATGASLPTTSTFVPPASAHDVLAPLLIDDHPRPAGYRRDEWPTWKDIDGDHCDAREQALLAASVPATQPSAGCKVSAGHWTSAYDGFSSTSAGDFDVDHVVPLENAYASGGDRWSTDRRTRYANDQADLWVVSASANRSKGARGPDQWRPPDRAIWCEYATRWVAIKVRWELTATTTERDALGQMLDTCPPVPEFSSSPQ